MSDERKQLRVAVAADDLTGARRLLEAGADPNQYQGLLRLVAVDGSSEMAALLLDFGADIDRRDTDGWTALTTADAWENTAVADLLEARGADPTARHRHGYTDLHRAARRNDLAAVEEFIAVGHLDTLDSSGSSALAEAIDGDHHEMVGLLLDAGADPDAHGGDWSPLAEAAHRDSSSPQSISYVAMLLSAGADPRPSGYPPVLASVNQEGSSAATIARLVAAGADIDAADPYDNGGTVLHRIARIAGDALLIETAVRCGATLDARDADGNTALSVSAEANNASIVRSLLDAGADVAARNDAGLTAIDLVGTDPTLAFDRADEVVLLLRAALDHPSHD